METRDIMNTAQAAQYLGIDPSTLRKWRTAETCHLGPDFSKPAGRAFYRREDLDKWLDDAKVVRGD